MIYKPTRGMKLNRRHPLARGLSACWLMNERSGNVLYDLAKHGNGIITGASWVPDGLEINAANEQISLASDRHINWDRGSIALKFKSNVVFNDSVDHYLFGSRGPTNNAGDFFINKYSDNIMFFLFYDVQTHYVSYTSPDIPNWQEWSSYVYRWSNGVELSKIETSSMTLHVDGIETLTGSEVQNSTWNSYIMDSIYGIGNDPERGTAQYADGIFEYFYIYDRAITDEEIKWIHREPYAMFDWNRIFSIPIKRLNPNLQYLRR